MNYKKTTTAILVGLLGAASLTQAFYHLPDPPEIASEENSTSSTVSSSEPAPVQLHSALKYATLEEALSQRWLKPLFSGDGKSVISGTVRNRGSIPMILDIPAGTLFEAGDNQMVTVRDIELQIAPLIDTRIELPAVATRATNEVGNYPYEYADTGLSEIAAFLPYVQKHPELHLPAIQTAVLALTENLPLSAFATFDLMNGESAVAPHNPAFKVDVRYIIQALQALKDIGHPMDRLALTVDPQLQIEAMLDPLTHAAALTYYQIERGNEWAFWQDHLANGNKATRHYALFGIARYFPEVALTMLPRWVREKRLDPLYRVSAAKSLSETGREEALTILDQLHYEYLGELEMEVALHNSKQLLSQVVSNPFRWSPPVDFQWAPPTLMELVENGRTALTE